VVDIFRADLSSYTWQPELPEQTVPSSVSDRRPLQNQPLRIDSGPTLLAWANSSTARTVDPSPHHQPSRARSKGLLARSGAFVALGQNLKQALPNHTERIEFALGSTDKKKSARSRPIMRKASPKANNPATSLSVMCYSVPARCAESRLWQAGMFGRYLSIQSG